MVMDKQSAKRASQKSRVISCIIAKSVIKTLLYNLLINGSMIKEIIMMLTRMAEKQEIEDIPLHQS